MAAQAAAEVVRLTSAAASRESGKLNKDAAATKIQTAFRCYLVRCSELDGDCKGCQWSQWLDNVFEDLIDFCKDTGLQSSTDSTRNSTIKLIGSFHNFVGPDSYIRRVGELAKAGLRNPLRVEVKTEAKDELASASSKTPLGLEIEGFDEYMNLVLDDAEEVNIKKNTRKSLGEILLKAFVIPYSTPCPRFTSGKWSFYGSWQADEGVE
ncbi:hypothetical protein MKW98_011783 [Papaver atlanticum]|uniref:Sm protein E n=1 Tax=Papaver atlanticum TaxID=357466 RepID=A0AAD4SPH2_9MAGN|nr:hypothetical protein MKW98_011783 [Papaver atlanticum]